MKTKCWVALVLTTALGTEDGKSAEKTKRTVQWDTFRTPSLCGGPRLINDKLLEFNHKHRVFLAAFDGLELNQSCMLVNSNGNLVYPDSAVPAEEAENDPFHFLFKQDADWFMNQRFSSMNCGQKAREHLERQINGRLVHCIPTHTVATPGLETARPSGLCYVMDGKVVRLLNAWMVQQGHGVGMYGGIHDFSKEEKEAAIAKRGIWSSKWVSPSAWRQGKRLSLIPFNTLTKEQRAKRGFGTSEVLKGLSGP